MRCFHGPIRFICPLVVVFMLFLSPAANANKLQPSMKPAAENPKVDKALEIIQNGTSYKAVSMALKKLDLNKQEQQLLAAKGKKQPYAGIIQRLQAVEKKKTESMLKEKAAPKLQRIKTSERQKQQQELRRLNQQVAAKITTLKSRSIKTATRLTPRQTVMHRSTLPESTGPRATITGVSPQPANPGSRVTIRGDHLGSTTRNVYLVINRQEFECAVTRWADSSVDVTIPRSVETIVGESEKTGSIYIELPTYSHSIRVAPVASTLVPSISDLSGRTIRPGQTLVIEGNQFLTESRGTVSFRFDGRDIGGRVSEWENTYIVVDLPDDVEGLPEVAGTVRVRNHAGNEVTRSITFQPALETDSIEHYHTTSATWFIGRKETFEDNRLTLANGWTVKEYWIEVSVDAWGGG